jgi:hypothetical protein
MTTVIWDEPAGAASPRGWLHVSGTVTGFYLDYGPDHYRASHQTDAGGGGLSGSVSRTTCAGSASQGTSWPSATRDGPGTSTTSRYTETIAGARQFVETEETATRSAKVKDAS